MINWIFDWPMLQYQDIAENLTKDEFAQNLKYGSDVYEHVVGIFQNTQTFSSKIKLCVTQGKMDY